MGNGPEDAFCVLRPRTFRHPNPDELFAIASSAAGRDLTWFFDAVHRSAATFDYAVAEVFDQGEGDDMESTVVVRRLQEGVFPVEVRTTFDDGWSASERWDGRDSWRAVQIPPQRACPNGRDRSGADSDAGPELHEQLVDGGAACRGGLPQVGAPLDDVAPDGARDLCLLRLTTRPRLARPAARVDRRRVPRGLAPDARCAGPDARHSLGDVS